MGFLNLYKALPNGKFCPLCENELIKEENGQFSILYRCRNHCYQFYYHLGITGHIVLGEEFKILCIPDQRYLEKESKEIMDKIAYWKENDRYLAKILGV